ncbi:MAG: AMP-binding protein [Tumebacillaceae bacterium]
MNDKLSALERELQDNYPFYQKADLPYQAFTDLPIIDKKTINAQRDQFERPNLGKVYESFTSGTTGIPFRCIKTPEENTKLTMAIYKHRRKWGLPLRHQMMLLSNRFLAEEKMLAHYYKQLHDTGAHMLQGRLSQLYEIAVYIREHALPIPPSLLFLQNWGEPVQPSQKRVVEEVFGVPLVDYYGMEELWCIAFSNEKGELEVDESLVYLEVVDPQTGEPLPAGEYGEVLVTSHVMRSLPYVRYRTGDLGKLHRDAETGSLILSLMPVRYSQIRLPERRFQVAIFRYLDRFFYEMHQKNGVRQFQMVQETLTSFRLLVAGDEGMEVECLTGKLKALLTQCLGTPVDLVIEVVPSIAPHPISGKYQSFVSLVEQGGES